MKALIYCRVSSQRQVDEGNGLGSQEQRCRVYAQSKNYEVIKVFPDEGVSGGLFERPAMKQLIAYLDAHPLEKFVIIFDDLARFARDVKVHIQLKTELVSRGAKLECLNFNFEDSEESEFAELILAASNQYQRKSNKRQVIQKQKARLEKGYWAFCLPRGLINTRDPIHGKIPVPREPYASIFKKAIEKFRDNLLITPEEVKNYLHAEFEAIGLLSRPSLSSVQKMLRNPLYAGYIEYKPWGVPFMKAKHEGFISLETYNLVQERLQGRSKPWKRRDYSQEFPLRPHVLCNTCGKPMTGSFNGGRNRKYPNYFCRTKGCVYVWKVVSKSKMEIEFETLLLNSKPADEDIDLTKDVFQEQWGIRLEKYTEHRARILAGMSDVDAVIKSYVERVGKTKDEDLIVAYEEEIKDLKRKKKEGEKDLGKRKYTSEEFGTASEKVLNTLKDPMSMWKSEEYNDKRAILFMYFEDQLRHDYNLGFGTASLAYPVKLINDIGQAKNGSVEMSSSELESKKLH